MIRWIPIGNNGRLPGLVAHVLKRGRRGNARPFTSLQYLGKERLFCQPLCWETKTLGASLELLPAAFASFRRSLCARSRSWRRPSISSRPRISANAFHFSDFVLLMKSARVRPRRRKVSLRDNSQIPAAGACSLLIVPPREPLVTTSTAVGTLPFVTFLMAC